MRGFAMVQEKNRWTLPDIDAATAWCRARNEEGIHCLFDVLAEPANDKKQAAQSVDGYLSCLRAIWDKGLDASVSIKPSTLGDLFDPEICQENAQIICGIANESGIGFEIDMEGRSTVDLILDLAQDCQIECGSVTIALQAYLDRSRGDLAIMNEAGVRSRLVKGAYSGDSDDHKDIQDRLKALAQSQIYRDRSFCIATHDPEILSWVKERVAVPNPNVEMDFLMGLANKTKVELASEGWKVGEYVPYGKNDGGYIIRRENYLASLRSLGKTPLP
jgi:proline dehydrogenase